MSDQPARSQDFQVRVSADYGLFTRPETKAEPASYSVITPSAAVGILEAVLWKPAMRWVVTQVAILAPIRFFNFRRNEVSDKPNRNHFKGAPYVVNERRTQRNRLLLYRPDYAITAHIRVVPENMGPEDNLYKFVNMFRDRMDRGQSFRPPVMGTTEFPAWVRWYDNKPPQPVDEDFGMMQLGGWFGSQSRFFRAVAKAGVVDLEGVMP